MIELKSCWSFFKIYIWILLFSEKITWIYVVWYDIFLIEDKENLVDLHGIGVYCWSISDLLLRIIIRSTQGMIHIINYCGGN
jgi:hypothetical protein